MIISRLTGRILVQGDDQDLKTMFTSMFLLTRKLCTLLQGLTLISDTQTGCRRLDLYIEQKKFLACGTEFSVEFSAPPEFSGGVTEKVGANLRPSEIMN